jgi:uncharacterized heparinase superfamily protein
VTEEERQILPDGGHVSRNPGALIELLLDLCRCARPSPRATSRRRRRSTTPSTA